MKKPKSLAIRVASMHSFLIKLGPRVGGGLIRLTAFYALYRVFSNGGMEALAYVCYEHLLLQAEKEKKAWLTKQNAQNLKTPTPRAR